MKCPFNKCSGSGYYYLDNPPGKPIRIERCDCDKVSTLKEALIKEIENAKKA